MEVLKTIAISILDKRVNQYIKENDKDNNRSV